MTDARQPFTFVDDPLSFRDPDALVVRIPAKARGKEKLLGVLARGLQFPRYFGHNWDALEECLGDLSWLADVPRVVIVHEGLPFSPAGEHLATYLAILREAVARRSTNPPVLSVVFPTSRREAIS
jgi:hypothetical protein